MNKGNKGFSNKAKSGAHASTRKWRQAAAKARLNPRGPSKAKGPRRATKKSPNP